MPYLTCDPAISLDGFIAGPDQSLDNPLGVGGMELHRWHMEQEEENQAEIDAICTAGAYIMGRNMFASGRGEWVEMQGGTTFHFVTGGPEEALRLATEAAGDRTISIAGGASTINQFLRAGHIDELRLHVAPIVLGSGEAIFTDLKGLPLEVASTRSTSLVVHLTLKRVRG